MEGRPLRLIEGRSSTFDKSRTSARGLMVAALLLLYGYTSRRGVQAHTGVPPAPHDLWQAWHWDPWLLLGLSLTALLYGRAVVILWRRAGVGLGVSWEQVWLFGMGMGTLFVALISPLDTLSTALFSAHMAQHLLLLY